MELRHFFPIFCCIVKLNLERVEMRLRFGKFIVLEIGLVPIYIDIHNIFK